MSERRALWPVVGLAVVGALLVGHALAGQSGTDAPKKSCCHAKHASAAPAACPIHQGDHGWIVNDEVAAKRLRLALRDGVFRPWVELGRAPTPDEIAGRLKLPASATDELLDQLEACGQTMTTGILRVPQSSLIAVAWPFSNVPTGITVALDGAKPVFSRCAVDALGTSKMLGKRATVEATTRDGGPRVRVIIDGDHLVSIEPRDAVVVHAESCDDIAFFSSKAAADLWAKEHGGDAQVWSMKEAVQRGAKFFGRFTEGL